MRIQILILGFIGLKVVIFICLENPISFDSRYFAPNCEGVNSTLLFGFSSSVFAILCLSLLNPFTARVLDGVL